MELSPDQIFILTQQHLITGHLQLPDVRLSDFLNDKLQSTIILHNASLTHLGEPGEKVSDLATVVIRKEQVVVALEPSELSLRSSRRLYARVKKQARPVLLGLNGIQVQGELHSSSRFDEIGLKELIFNNPNWFLPVTQATLRSHSLDGQFPECVTIIVNLKYVEFVALGAPVSRV